MLISPTKEWANKGQSSGDNERGQIFMTSAYLIYKNEFIQVDNLGVMVVQDEMSERHQTIGIIIWAP